MSKKTFISYTEVGFNSPTDELVHIENDIFLTAIWTGETPSPKCIKITDCISGNSISVYSELLQKYIGSTLKISLNGLDKCITISETEDEECVDISETKYKDFEILHCYECCEECLPKAKKLICPTPPIGRTLRPGWITGVCDNRVYEKVSCNYSEAVFQKSIEQRYKVEFCCEKDLIKESIKFEMMNLEMLK